MDSFKRLFGQSPAVPGPLSGKRMQLRGPPPPSPLPNAIAEAVIDDGEGFSMTIPRTRFNTRPVMRLHDDAPMPISDVSNDLSDKVESGILTAADSIAQKAAPFADDDFDGLFEEDVFSSPKILSEPHKSPPHPPNIHTPHSSINPAAHPPRHLIKGPSLHPSKGHSGIVQPTNSPYFSIAVKEDSAETVSKKPTDPLVRARMLLDALNGMLVDLDASIEAIHTALLDGLMETAGD